MSGVLTVQVGQELDIVANKVGPTLEQPTPVIEAVRLPETPVGTTIPVIVPLMEQLLHPRPENGIEKAPVLLTTVVPDAGALHRVGVTKGGLAMIA